MIRLSTSASASIDDDDDDDLNDDSEREEADEQNDHQVDYSTNKETTNKMNNQQHQQPEQKFRTNEQHQHQHQNQGDNNNSKPKRNPYCSRCRNHGKSAQVKGHKRHCEYRDCLCHGCRLVACRQLVSAAQIKRRRYQKQDEECGRHIEISPPVLTRQPNNDPADLIAETLIGGGPSAAAAAKHHLSLQNAVDPHQSGALHKNPHGHQHLHLHQSGRQQASTNGTMPITPTMAAAASTTTAATTAAAAANQQFHQQLNHHHFQQHASVVVGAGVGGTQVQEQVAAVASHNQLHDHQSVLNALNGMSNQQQQHTPLHHHMSRHLNNPHHHHHNHHHLQVSSASMGQQQHHNHHLTSPQQLIQEHQPRANNPGSPVSLALSNALHLFHYPNSVLSAAAAASLASGSPHSSSVSQPALPASTLSTLAGLGGRCSGFGLGGGLPAGSVAGRLAAIEPQHPQQHHQQVASGGTGGGGGTNSSSASTSAVSLASSPLPSVREQITLVEEIHDSFGPLAIYAWLRSEQFDLQKIRDLIELSRVSFDELLQMTGHSALDLTSPIVD